MLTVGKSRLKGTKVFIVLFFLLFCKFEIFQSKKGGKEK